MTRGCIGGRMRHKALAADAELWPQREEWPGWRLEGTTNTGAADGAVIGRTLFCRLTFAPPDSSRAMISVRPLLAARCKHASPV